MDIKEITNRVNYTKPSLIVLDLYKKLRGACGSGNSDAVDCATGTIPGNGCGDGLTASEGNIACESGNVATDAGCGGGGVVTNCFTGTTP
ncbi:MAG: hypothetical protein HQ564_00090 [Candidatus Saganbacteria bacterium]|nr:hypothetical protein [Candidatus Saganbacteria bacterium]